MDISKGASIGIFDSGLGGLVIAKSIISKLPKYNYVYLGDTKNVPYGNKSQQQVYSMTKKALLYLFKQNCKLVIIACNTSSAKALRKIQREFLPKYFPDRKVLGVIVPTIEAVAQAPGLPADYKIGIIATKSTVESHAYKKELLKLNPKAQVYEQAAPLLTSLIEANNLKKARAYLKTYLKPLLAKKIDSLILGCTHYPILKREVKGLMGKNVRVISQDEIIGNKLKDYLRRHKEIADELSNNGKRTYEVTKLNKNYKKITQTLFGKNLNFKLVKV